MEAIRQLEGDHLFADDRLPSGPNYSPVSPPSASAQQRAMEISPPSSNTSPHHRIPTMVVTGHTQPTKLTYHCSEVPLALTSPANSSANNNNHSMLMHEQGESGAGPVITARPIYHPQPTNPTVIPVTTTVTSLKHHVLNRLARSGEMEEQPINLEYRPVSRSPSPPPSHCIQQQQQQQHYAHGHQILYAHAPQSTTSVAQFHIQQQQQQRPGVIVVKHS